MGKYGNGIQVSDGNGNEVIEMGGNWYEKSVTAHLYLISRQMRINRRVYESAQVTIVLVAT